MEVSEDGTITGSIDVSKLDEIDPKTDEAKAQLAALKAEAQAGLEQTQPVEESPKETTTPAGPGPADGGKAPAKRPASGSDKG
jgi:hypothetical protein